ncbi:ABC transporter permease [Segetibacter aerophilus]|uniref:ABC transporter permease n=1 Tax=Segetibacter aerophilus TaxID=670293 RepID=A0A512BB58_9BACT|nr:ABC transporter permease [Segetibacter aerophilus]
MLKNYLKIAIRNLAKHKLFSFINIFGLALSMSVCMMVLINLKDQISYDKFHPNTDRTYRVITELTNKEGSSYRFASSPLPLANSLTTDYNFIEKTVRLYSAGGDKASTGTKELSINGAFTEPTFFDVFGFTLKEGNEKTALSAPNSVVLSKTTAEKFFGNANPVGQTIKLAKLGDFQVTGVLEIPTGKSHIDFEAYMSLSSVPALEKSGKLTPAIDKWDAQIHAYTYLQLKDGANKKQLDKALSQVTAGLIKTTKLQGKENIAFEAQRFNKIILGEELMNAFGNVGSMEKTLGPLLIGFIILLSACFNYTNLSIARSLNRGKEVGIRKVAGAFRYQVFYQFILESVLIAFLSLGLAWIILHLLQQYAPFMGEMAPSGLALNNGIYGWFVVFAIFTGLLAGSLPAWVLSSFKPVEVLKNLSNIKLFGGNGFRKGLIVVQFTLALVTTIFTSISSQQFSFIANADPGYNRDNLLVVPTDGADPKILSAEIERVSGVQNVTATSATFGRNSSGHIPVKLQPGAQAIEANYYDVDRNFTEVMDLKIVAGENLPENTSTNEKYVLLNETATRTLNFKTPADAVGKMIWLTDTTQVQVAGVLKDFHFQTLAVQLTPLVVRNRPNNFNFLLVKTNDANSTIVSRIEQVWKKNALQPFESSWLKEEQIERQGAKDTVSTLGFLAFMTITIACLGLLGMVIYNTETRRKEIGIRKVMGASVSTIISLLSKSFLKLVIIAGLIAMPIAYVLGFIFTHIFANRIDIGLGSLIFSFLGLLALVLITISSQIFKVATANPVESLRTE